MKTTSDLGYQVLIQDLLTAVQKSNGAYILQPSPPISDASLLHLPFMIHSTLTERRIQEGGMALIVPSRLIAFQGQQVLLIALKKSILTLSVAGREDFCATVAS